MSPKCPTCLLHFRQHFSAISAAFLLFLKYLWRHRQHLSDLLTVFLLQYVKNVYNLIQLPFKEVQNVHDVMDNTSLNMSTAFILCPKCLWRHRQHFLDISTVFLLCLKYPWGHRQHFSDISTVFLLCPKYLWRHRQHFSDLSTAFLDPSIIINICYLRETEACV